MLGVVCVELFVGFCVEANVVDIELLSAVAVFLVGPVAVEKLGVLVVGIDNLHPRRLELCFDVVGFVVEFVSTLAAVGRKNLEAVVVGYPTDF